MSFIKSQFDTPEQWQRWRALLIRFLLVSALLHGLAAWFSAGFLSADEHFQILEFISYKLGHVARENLSIEFPYRMRSWFLPAVGYGLVRAAQAVGIVNPMIWAFIVRLSSAALGWASVAALALASPLWVRTERARTVTLAALGLLCFLPGLHARPSSENWGGALFALGVSTFAIAHARGRSGVTREMFVVGVALGAAFECRFQMGVAIAGFALWILWTQRTGGFRALHGISHGIVVIFLVARLIDRWGYGVWAFSPANYFQFNLVANHVSDFGTSPWWDYFRMSFTEAWPPAGLALFIWVLVSFVAAPFHPFTWSYVPFLLVHTAIAHKELRFLYPIVHVAPVMLGLALDRAPWFSRLALSRPLRYSALFDNGIGLVLLTLLPASRVAGFYSRIYDLLPEPNAKLEVLTFNRDPYIHLGSPMTFYKPPGVSVSRLGSSGELKLALSRSPGGVWLFYEGGFEFPPQAAGFEAKCRADYRNLPLFMRDFHLPENVRIWTLYRCRP